MNYQIELIVDYLEEVNYALVQSRLDLCKWCVVENKNEEDIPKLQLVLSGDFIETFTSPTYFVGAHQSVRISDIDLIVKVAELAKLTERVYSNFTIKAVAGEEIVYENVFPISLMAYDQWSGTENFPQTLASFVTPNHPCIAKIIHCASEYLMQDTGDASFTNYLSQNPDEVYKQISAIYRAVQDEQITYSVCPPSYEEAGQRVRLADKVLTDKIGNCLDLSLLFAACMEYVGINPFIILVPNHSFVGAWLVPDSHTRSVDDDATFLINRCTNNINYILLFESTSVTQVDKISFEEAIQNAMTDLYENQNHLVFLDIYRCRAENYRPLPQLIHEEGNWRLSTSDDRIADTDEVPRIVQYGMKNEEEEAIAVTRTQLWERKLLDFTLRNTLLNVRLNSALQMISVDVCDLAKQLYIQHRGFTIESCPESIEGVEHSDEDSIFDSMQLDMPALELVRDDMKSARLHTYHTEGDTTTILKKLRRTSRLMMEENGANSLYLALGLLQWQEEDTVETRIAPILLMPIEIVYRNAVFRIKSNAEEIMLNVTLFEYLKQTFEMDFPGLEQAMTEDTDFDVQKIFTIVQQSLVKKAHWKVAEECILGIFSFGKFVMWNDLHKNHSEICKNEIVKALVDADAVYKKTTENVDPAQLDQKLLPGDFCLPLPYDSSQLCAVMEAMKKQSFILHGPPGTGKSQTIANMITSALYKGKRVLFVSEKMAALSVVQNRLEKLGLSPFCLELHSNKSTKQHLLGQLETVLSLSDPEKIAEYESTANEVLTQRKELLQYVDALHQRTTDKDFSLYECIMHYCRFKNAQQSPVLDFGLVWPAIGPENLQQYEYFIDRLSVIIRLVGQSSKHPLRGMIPGAQTSMKLPELRAWLKDLAEKSSKLPSLVSDIQQLLPVQIDNLSQLKTNIRRLREYITLRKSLMAGASAEIFSLNAASLLKEWSQIQSFNPVKKFFKQCAFVKRLEAYYPAIQKSMIPAHLRELLAFQNQEYYQQLSKQMVNKPYLLDSVLDTYAEWGKSLRHVLEIVEIENTTEIRIDEAEALFRGWMEHLESLKDWKQWCLIKEDLHKKKMGSISYLLEHTDVELDVLKKAYFNNYFKNLVLGHLAANPTLDLFNGLLFDEKIDHYRDLVARFQELSRKELCYLLAKRVCDLNNHSTYGEQMKILRRNLSNHGRGTSIRRLFEQIPNVLAEFCPCMLMSPMSVAQYIDIQSEKFDLVIFDEASQIPTCEAVGAIARGKNVVIAGDSKQMPPTSFFSNTRVLEDEYAMDDLESILEDCQSLKLPALLLSWHYRSRHESLIAFSNNEYYDNQLNTFPAIDDQERRVIYVPVKGVYQKGGARSNKQEALAVVNEIERRLTDEHLRRLSIGVISFNVQQQYLIEDLLEERMDKNKQLRQWAEACGEPIFVKNLENVQGDERDVILFSVGYGPDRDGRISMNFGPLNLMGGERRLNVAVTRSRYEMRVYTSLHASDIDLRRSNAQGVIGLKRFLDYAENGTFVQPAVLAEKVHPDPIITNQIAAELRKNGLVVNTFVGKSRFKVHLAIPDPNEPAKYLLGILLDDKIYLSTPTMSDREVVQPSLLHSLGWNMMHVWSVDWFERPQYVVDSILRKLEELKIKK